MLSDHELRRIVNEQQVLLEQQLVMIEELRKELAMARLDNELAAEGSRKGGKAGGKARAAKLTAEERSRIARVAAAKRWSKQKGTDHELACGDSVQPAALPGAADAEFPRQEHPVAPDLP